MLYSDVIKHRGRIANFFSNPARKPRVWLNYPCSGNVLSFGSGNVDSANYREIKSIYENVFSCDSDISTGADYKSLDEINEKFDLIICEHVFEHIRIEDFVNGFAQKMYDISSNDSTLVATIPNIYNPGSFFCDFDHKNFSSPQDLAAIFCCVGFELVDFYRWSKMKHMFEQNDMTDTEKSIEAFLEKHYGLQADRYLTMVLKKNGQV